MKKFTKSIVIITAILLISFSLSGCYNINGIEAVGGGKVTELENISGELTATGGMAVISFNVQVTEMPDDAVTGGQMLDAEGFINFRDLKNNMDLRADIDNVYYEDTDVETMDGIVFFGVSSLTQNSTGEELFICVYINEILTTEKDYVNIAVLSDHIDPLDPPDPEPVPVYTYYGELKGHIKMDTY